MNLTLRPEFSEFLTQRGLDASKLQPQVIIDIQNVYNEVYNLKGQNDEEALNNGINVLNALLEKNGAFFWRCRKNGVNCND